MNRDGFGYYDEHRDEIVEDDDPYYDILDDALDCDIPDRECQCCGFKIPYGSGRLCALCAETEDFDRASDPTREGL